MDFSTVISTLPEKFPLVIGMHPLAAMTAGGSLITFFGRRLDAFPALGAHFVPADSALPPLYGFVHSRSQSTL